MKFVFFRSPKPKPFEYKPRYYDPEKEKREQRRKELGLSDDADHRSFFRGELKNRWKRGGETDKRNTRTRSIIYLFILLFAIYYIFFTDFVQKLVDIITLN